ncbi:hypothetical protein [Piscirickettsia salmonis]|uniref:hypothetical protein n=1 Tax=Piscirickettsia salmonis TaxID=1238 RepID=UPI00143D5765|nr:hypothetical protein [Piscirickettsia salmonis]QIX57311.1 hypothetical protein GW536_17975 [Piscirickettsia salmonis]
MAKYETQPLCLNKDYLEPEREWSRVCGTASLLLLIGPKPCITGAGKLKAIGKFTVKKHFHHVVWGDSIPPTPHRLSFIE